MATQKTTSSTIPCGEYNYIFLNPPDTQFITFIRFKDPTKVQKGIINTIDSKLVSKAGPIDTTTVGQKDIRLFYIEDDGGDVVSEAMLLNANLEDTDPTNAWILNGPKMNFEDKISSGARAADSTVFLSASVNNQGNPIVVYKAKGGKRGDFIQYCVSDGSKWKLEQLEIPKQT